MVKYKKHFLTMLEENQDLFNQFKKLEERFAAGEEDVKEEFNSEGNKVLRVVRRYEDELCAKSEGGRYGKFSENLSEKFQQEVKSYFPQIDRVRLD